MAFYRSWKGQVQVGEVYRIAGRADFITCLGGNKPFKIAFDGNSPVEAERGLTFSPAGGFDQVTIYGDSAEVLDLEFGFGDGEVKDARLTVPQDFLNAMATPDSGFTKITSVPANTADKAIAANNPNRRELIISNEGSLKIYVKFQIDTPINTFAGVPVAAGAQVAFEHSGPVWAANLDAASVADLIYVTERGFNLSYIPPTGT